jgi:hypothetical protein
MRFRFFLFICIAWAWSALAAPAPETELTRGDIVRVLRPQMLFFYGKPHHMAKAGETFEVLDVRPLKKQVYVATNEGGRIVALSLPIDAVQSERQAKNAERIEKSTALFAGLIPTLNLRVEPQAIERLRKEPRSYIEAAIEEVGSKTYEHLAIKLKGSAGSFRGIDDRPGFSINCSKYKGGDRFHGLKRFQLNNCAQDGTALNELVAGEMARAAGVPASRCTHALVSINGRELGIYVLKEGFTEEFLAAFFKKTDGNLYDGGFVSDIQENMELDRGDAPRDGLLKLVAALKEPDAAKQFDLLSAAVDVDAYLRYLALESVLCHWDGYSFNRNNYRIYENPETGRFHFILHGMDQMFGDAGQSVQRDPGGQVGAVLWRRPEIRERYWVQLTDIYEKVLKSVDWAARVEEHGQRLLAALKPEQAKQYEPNIVAARNRVAERLKQVRLQIEKPRVVNTLAAKGAGRRAGVPVFAGQGRGECVLAAGTDGAHGQVSLRSADQDPRRGRAHHGDRRGGRAACLGRLARGTKIAQGRFRLGSAQLRHRFSGPRFHSRGRAARACRRAVDRSRKSARGARAMSDHERFEFKFLVTAQQRDEVCATFNGDLRPDTNGGSGGVYPIVSLYYDTLDWRCYWEAWRGLPSRRKLRVRVYGTAAGDIAPTSFVEVKHKLDGLGVKRRVHTSLPHALEIGRGGGDADHFAPVEARTVREVHRLVHQDGFRPVCAMRYRRHAFALHLEGATSRCASPSTTSWARASAISTPSRTTAAATCRSSRPITSSWK